MSGESGPGPDGLTERLQASFQTLSDGVSVVSVALKAIFSRLVYPPSAGGFMDLILLYCFVKRND